MVHSISVDEDLWVFIAQGWGKRSKFITSYDYFLLQFVQFHILLFMEAFIVELLLVTILG